MAESVLGNVLEFFQRLGVFEVILPFLLTFTLVYAILQRSKVLGEGKKNLDAMVAVSIAIITVGSSYVVQGILQVSAQMVMVLMLGVFFLLLVGSFYKEGKIWDKDEGLPKWLQHTFIVIIFVAIISIFLHAIRRQSGQSWLEFIIDYLARYWDSTAVASIILVLLIIGFIIYVTGEKTKEKEAK